MRGRDVNLENFGDVRGRGSLAREYAITYRDTLESTSGSSDGTFWTGAGAAAGRCADLEVSIEESIHERFNINVGDEMRFDVLGRTMPRG